MKFESKIITPSKAEQPPSLGESLTHKYLNCRKNKDSETNKALFSVCDRARSEFLMYGRDTAGAPETSALADYINGQMPKILKTHSEPLEVYADIMDKMTDYIRRKQEETRDNKVTSIKKAA